MENVLRLDIGSEQADEALLRGQLLSSWTNIVALYITQNVTYVIFANAKESNIMLKSGSFQLEDNLVQVQKLDSETEIEDLRKGISESLLNCETEPTSLLDVEKDIDIQPTSLKSKLKKYSNGNEIEAFLKRYPDIEKSIEDIFNSEEKKLQSRLTVERAEYDYQKGHLIEDIMKQVDFLILKGAVDFKVLPGYKYRLGQLEKDDLDFKLIKGSLDLNETDKTLNIFRIVSNQNNIDESDISDPSKLLLLHGTPGGNVNGILKEGFKPSERGSYGPGVYMTNSLNMAARYSDKYMLDEQQIVKKVKYLFVNKVLPTVETETKILHSSKIPTFEEYLESKPETKVIHYGGQSSFKKSPQDKYDSKNNRIIRGTFQVANEEEKIILSHHDLVVPAYLVVISEELNVKNFVEHFLYRRYNVEKCITNYGNLIESTLNAVNVLSDKQTSSKDDKCSLSYLRKALEKEITSNYFKTLNFLTSKFEWRFNSIMQQLSFEISSLSDQQPAVNNPQVIPQVVVGFTGDLPNEDMMEQSSSLEPLHNSDGFLNVEIIQDGPLKTQVKNEPDDCYFQV